MIFPTWIFLFFTSLVTRLLPPLMLRHLPKSRRLNALAAEMPLIVLSLLLIHMLIPMFSAPISPSIDLQLHQTAQWIQIASIALGLATCLIASTRGAPLIISIFGAIASKTGVKALLTKIFLAA